MPWCGQDFESRMELICSQRGQTACMAFRFLCSVFKHRLESLRSVKDPCTSAPGNLTRFSPSHESTKSIESSSSPLDIVIDVVRIEITWAESQQSRAAGQKSDIAPQRMRCVGRRRPVRHNERKGFPANIASFAALCYATCKKTCPMGAQGQLLESLGKAIGRELD